MSFINPKEQGMFIDIADLATKGAEGCVIQNRRGVIKGSCVKVDFNPDKKYLKARYKGEVIYQREVWYEDQILNIIDLKNIYKALSVRKVFAPKLK